MTEETMTDETVAERVWRQASSGVLDRERLLPSNEKRLKDLLKKLDRPLEKNGWRIFVGTQAYAILNGKAPQKRNAEIMVVETVGRWAAEVRELAPERLVDLQRIVETGCNNPAPLPPKG